MPTRKRTDLTGESGLTLIELVVAMAIAVIITGAAVTVLVSSLNRQGDLTQRADQIGDARLAVERIVRDVRQGVVGSVTAGSTGTKLELQTYVDGKCGATAVTSGTKCLVKITCASEKCTRETGTSGGTATTIITGVKNSEPFTYLSGPTSCSGVTGPQKTFVSVTIELRSKKSGVTKIEDGAGLRSCS